MTKLTAHLHQLIAGLLSLHAIAATAAGVATPPPGKAIVFDRNKGNCLSCHVIADGELPGDIGPTLVNMRQRFPSKARLRAQIYDPTVNNPNTLMPPFGRHGLLTDSEINQIVEYLYTL